MMIAQLVQPEEGEESVLYVELRDNDGTIRQVARIAESSREWEIIITLRTP